MTVSTTAQDAMPGKDGSARLRPQDLRSWVDSLPFANLGVSLGHLAAETSRLNASAVKPTVRLDLLEIHATAYHRLLEALQRDPGARNIAIFEKRRAVADTTRALTTNLATGYGLVVDQVLGHGRVLRFTRTRILASALQRAVLFLCHTLLHYHDHYLPPDPSLWSELDRLCRLAVAQKLAQRSVPARGLSPEFGASVLHLYKRALLTGLIDPQRHGEIWQVSALLESYVDDLRILDKGSAPQSEGVFVFDPKGAYRSTPFAPLGAGQRCSDQSRLLDTGPLCAAVESMLEEIRNAKPESAVDARTQRHTASILWQVKRSLTAPAARRTRRTQRTAVQARVLLATGISACQRLFGGRALAAARASFDRSQATPLL